MKNTIALAFRYISAYGIGISIIGIGVLFYIITSNKLVSTSLIGAGTANILILTILALKTALKIKKM